MGIEASYTPGSALLVGSGRHWLLIEDSLDDDLVDHVWQLLGSPGRVVETVLEVLEQQLGPALPSLALIDATPGAVESATRAQGRITHDGTGRVLRLGEAAGESDGKARRVQGGILYAGSVRLVEAPALRLPRPVGTGSPAAEGHPMISGIPQHILAARAPDRPLTSADLARAIDSQSRAAVTGQPVGAFAPAEVAPPPAEAGGDAGVPEDVTTGPPAGRLGTDTEAGTAPEPGPGPTPSHHEGTDAEPESGPETGPEVGPDTGDHDGHTMMRLDEPTPAHPGDSDGHTVLRSDEHETVLAVHCPEGHLTAAFGDVCRVCGAPVPPSEPHHIPRPQLGVLRLPNGEVVPLDRGVVLGRKPAPIVGGERWPHLVHLPAQSTYLSRRHLQIELDGWLVLATDLGSQGGTRLHAPGREPELVRPHEPYVLEHGWVLDLADVYAVTFEVTG